VLIVGHSQTRVSFWKFQSLVSWQELPPGSSIEINSDDLPFMAKLDCSQLLRVSTDIIPDRKAACKTIFLPHWPQRLRSLIAWMKQKLRPFDVSEDSEESCWQPADQGNAQQAAIININADEPPRPKRSQVRTIGDHVAAWRMSFVR